MGNPNRREPPPKDAAPRAAQMGRRVQEHAGQPRLPQLTRPSRRSDAEALIETEVHISTAASCVHFYSSSYSSSSESPKVMGFASTPRGLHCLRKHGDSSDATGASVTQALTLVKYKRALSTNAPCPQTPPVHKRHLSTNGPCPSTNAGEKWYQDTRRRCHMHNSARSRQEHASCIASHTRTERAEPFMFARATPSSPSVSIREPGSSRRGRSHTRRAPRRTLPR